MLLREESIDDAAQVQRPSERFHPEGFEKISSRPVVTFKTICIFALSGTILLYALQKSGFVPVSPDPDLVFGSTMSLDASFVRTMYLSEVPL